MSYLDYARLDALDVEGFRNRKPYPWANPAGLLTPAGYAELLGNLPPVEQFEKLFGVPRKHGQQPHDRYALEYRPGLALPEPWAAFIDELHQPPYQRFLEKLYDAPVVSMRLHWHYTPAGCSVSPHCDNPKKLGSHIFYFNDAPEWRADWGGETVILDDGGKIERRAAPDFADFQRQQVGKAMGNVSLLFACTPHSWHGVRAISCPPDRLRKVFIVVVNRPSIGQRIGRRLRRAA